MAFDHYSEAGQEKSLCQSTKIAVLPVSQLARGDCLNLLWCYAPTLPQALDVTLMLRGNSAKPKRKLIVITGCRCTGSARP